MEINGKTVLLCDCEGTMALDTRAIERALEGGPCVANTQLCRAQLANAESALKGKLPVLIACTQEAPLFLETREEIERASEVSFVNVRERAGWSREGSQAGPKIAALVAEAALDLKPATAVSMESKGVLLVLGRDEGAIQAAKKLAGRLSPTVVLSGRAEDIPAPALMDVPVFRGKIRSASGRLGAFRVEVENFAPAKPSSRGALAFADASGAGVSDCDLILDMRGEAALFPGGEKRDGYFRPDPGSPAQVADALLSLADMVGTFEKPRYIAYDAAVCAHARSQKIGCRRCLDVCPTGATAPEGDGIRYDPYLCAGCGLCAAVCPTGAAAYQLPAGDGIYERLRVLFGTYFKAGGKDPVLLVHAHDKGGEILDALARFGDGLPARVVPFALNQPTQIGLDFLFAALAYGASRVLVLLTPDRDKNTEAFIREVSLAETVMAGLGYGAGRAMVVETADPEELAKALDGLAPTEGPKPFQFKIMGRKRQALIPSLAHLHAHAPRPVDILPLPEDAPFGAIKVDVAGCTLCLSCVGACPANALKDNPTEKPQLSFLETNCVQCGLCRVTCPEKVITLEPRLSFLPAARVHQVVKEEEPFKCIRCGKPFGTRSSIERIAAKLKAHPMFAGEGSLERLKMCDNCRVVALAEEETHPFAGPPRPMVRTTEDYLREREELRRAAKADLEAKGLVPGPGSLPHPGKKG
jgi:ferredoxin